jgi:DNA polymerase IV
MSLRVLFLDMNSFFASVEQQLRPELRGKPVAVAPIDNDHTSCIAVSQEARQLGFRTGSPVWQVRLANVHIIEARPAVYVRIHHAIQKAVNTCIPVHSVRSIDELSCLLDDREADPRIATTLAHKVKHAIAHDVGEYLKCSIGIAPNRFLAKVAADMQKPDGLTLLQDHDLPHALHPLKLNDLPGIGRRMLPRLAAAGITTVTDLCQLSELQLKQIWGGVVGQQWFYWLRGYNLPEAPTHRSTVGHSHVLPPEFRTLDGARAILIRLIHKTAARLRRLCYWAGALDIFVSFTSREEAWHVSIPLGHCQDTLAMLEAFEDRWRPPFPATHPIQVSATLHQLTSPRSSTLPLFPQEQQRVQLSHALDSLNDRFGADTVYFADMHGLKDAAPTRIAFNHIPEFLDQLP